MTTGVKPSCFDLCLEQCNAVKKVLAKKTTPQIWATVLLWVKWDHLTVGIL